MARGCANNYTSGNKCGLLSGQFPWVRTAEMKTDIWIHHITLTAGCVYCSDLLRLQILHVPLSTRRSGKTHQALCQSSVVVLSLSLCVSLSHTHSCTHTDCTHKFRQFQASFKKKHFLFCLVSILMSDSKTKWEETLSYLRFLKFVFRLGPETHPQFKFIRSQWPDFILKKTKKNKNIFYPTLTANRKPFPEIEKQIQQHTQTKTHKSDWRD